jgi:hemerythrin-like domain-containing protein
MQKTNAERRDLDTCRTAASLLSAPLDYFGAEQLRARQICALIEGIASGAAIDRITVQTILRFLNEDLSDHLLDEAEDLFPLLLRRCPSEYDVEQTFARIKLDQDKAAALLPDVRAVLARCLDTTQPLLPDESAMLTHFAAHTRRHILAENAILLPLARAHLSRRDLNRLSRRMKIRRGLTPIPETKNAE